MWGAKWVKEIKKYKFPVIKKVGLGDVLYSMGNRVNSIVLTLCGDRW